MPESRGPNRSLQERLVDERALSLALIPADVLATMPTREEIHLAQMIPKIPPRFGYDRSEPSIHDILSVDLVSSTQSDFPGYQGTSRPSMASY